MAHPPFEGRDVVQLLPVLDLVAETLDIGREGIIDQTAPAPKLGLRQLSIKMSHPLFIVTMTSVLNTRLRISSRNNYVLTIGENNFRK